MKEIQIEDLGYNQFIAAQRIELQLEAFSIGRVIQEYRERYTVLTDAGALEAELLGNLRYTAQSRSDLPVVGDWVALSAYEERKGLIHAVYPRQSLLERKAVGKTGEKQPIASNIDFGWIVQSLNRDFNLNRMERYLTICNASGIEPVIILSKIDLLEKSVLNKNIDKVQRRFENTVVFALSNETGEGLMAVKASIQPGKTYCLLGSSGVGKSSLINGLSGNSEMKTGAINDQIERGKHVTTHRALVPLEHGGILIDNPGMREVGIADSSAGLSITFQEIEELADSCRFKDCNHVDQQGCAVLEALNSGDLDEHTYENYLKLRREEAHYQSTVHQRKEKEKRFGKLIKQVIKQKKKDKF